MPNVLVIKPRQEDYETLARRLSQYGLEEDTEKSRYMGELRHYKVLDPGGRNALDLRPILLDQEQQLIEDVLLEHMPMLVPLCSIPEDPRFGWEGDITKIEAGLDIAALDDSAPVDICILDSGVDRSHPELLVGPGINVGSMMGDGSPVGNPRSRGHGTACAGVAAARGVNSFGVRGLAINCRILPAAIPNWTEMEVLRGINWATDQGAKVISMSFGMNAPLEGRCEYDTDGWNFAAIEPAIARADSRGVLMVAGTGNCDSTLNLYPARDPRVIAVGASDEGDHRKSFDSPDGEQWGSNYGPELSVVAPGVKVRTTDIRGLGRGYNNTRDPTNVVAMYNVSYKPAAYGDDDGDYFYVFDGTSAATARVAGLAALLFARYPSLSHTEVRQIIERTTDKVVTAGAYLESPRYPNGTRNSEVGYGRINPKRALSFAITLIPH
jgi:subtilisin family serine protease